MKQKLGWLFASVFFAWFWSGAAQAHTQGLMFIGSHMNGGGDLEIKYEFERHVAGLDYTGFMTVFETNELGFGAAEDDPPHIYELDLNTDVALEVIHLDPGTSMELNGNPITAPGTYLIGTHDQTGANIENSQLHNHPYFRLVAASDSSFAEGIIVFRLVQGTNGPGYTPSDTYVVHLSNGYVEEVNYGAGPSIDHASLECQRAVGAAGAKYFFKVHGLLRKCLDKVANWKARQAAGHSSASAALAQAEKACTDSSGTGPDAQTLLGKLSTLEAKTVSDAQIKCGTPSATTMDGRTIPASASGDFTERELRTHLGMVRCRAEEALGAAYAHVLHDLENFTARPSQGGQDLPHYLPCLKSRAHPQ